MSNEKLKKPDLFDKALRKLFDDKDAFSAILIAFDTFDTKKFISILEKLELRAYCTVICRWLCLRKCTLFCRKICIPLKIPQDFNDEVEIRKFGEISSKIFRDKHLISNLIDAYKKNDAAVFEGLLKEHDLIPFCIHICYWICTLQCKKYCLILCPPREPYMKIDPPPDVDKASHGHTGTGTCWMATASNMLAGAGYGTGTTVQVRADEIYGELVNHFGTGTGWIDTALDWWLSSTHNTWTTNPYTLVTVYGNKIPKNPWSDSNGARFIGNELRRCQFVGVSISWPTADASIGSGGHAITAWGDDGKSSTLTTNPNQIQVVDSDNDTGGDVQTYNYDAFNNPNPGGSNEGNGWYIDYSNNHPYIKHIVTLCPTNSVSSTRLTQKVTGSYKIHQSRKEDAVDLHYDVGTDVEILSYKTMINWQTDNDPQITEKQPDRTQLTVDWDTKDKPISYCTYITITTEFILPRWNAIWYDNVHFTYSSEKIITILPRIGWEMQTPKIEKPESLPNVTGGYVIGCLELKFQANSPEEIERAEYRFIHQYSFDQAPDKHKLMIKVPPGLTIFNVKLGHSYGYLNEKELWDFNDWLTDLAKKEFKVDEKPVEIDIDWEGKLPYPEGDW